MEHDDELMKRFLALKQPAQVKIRDKTKEVEQRLDKILGTQNSKLVNNPEAEEEDDEMEKLMRQVTMQVALESKSNSLFQESISSLATRLNTLKSDTKQILGADYATDSDDPGLKSNNLSDSTENVRAKRKIPSKLVKRGTCAVCTDSAICSCPDCDGDKYCMDCWTECHLETHTEMSTHTQKFFTK